MPNTVRSTRAARSMVLFATSAVLIAGCGSDSSDSDKSSDSAEVTLDGAYGEVTIPVTDEKVWALDPKTATELLQIGVTPMSAGDYGYKGDAAFEARQELLADEDIELVDPDNLELVLEAQPSLIVGSQGPSIDETIEELEKIAPVLITDATADWDESLTALAQVTGHEQQASSVIDHLDQEIEALEADIDDAGLAGETVSLMSACGDGSFCSYGNGRAAGPVLADVGLERPTVHGQDDPDLEWGYTTVSEEKLNDLVAPIIFILTGSVQYGAADPLDNPLFQVDDSTVGEVDFAAWYGDGSFDVAWILNDLRAVLLDEGSVADKERGVELFEQLRESTS